MGPRGHLGNCRPVPIDGSTEHWLATTDDYQGLRAEVKAWAMGLEGLSKGLCGQLLGGLGQVLRDEPALQALEDSVSELGCACGVLEGGVARELSGAVEQVPARPVHPHSPGRPHL